ncbi:MAG TPA: arylesterase [Candidatus Desulfobacillus sp.]|nr:arylesterase [Candidatus Desulfobacillus sp.]
MPRLIFACFFLLLSPALQAAGAILVVGDSLSAGYGLPQGQSWPSLLDRRLREQGLDYSVANASISGDTTAGGASRIGAALEQSKPAIVIIALGGNDGLRGLPVTAMRDNLAAMIAAAQARKARVVLAGMKLPPNYGIDYTRAFERSYAELARRHKTALVPFLLEGVADRRELFQPDNIHPVAEAQPLILDNVWRVLRPLLK